MLTAIFSQAADVQLEEINVRPASPRCVFPFELIIFSCSKCWIIIICTIFWTSHNGTSCLTSRPPSTTPTLLNVLGLWTCHVLHCDGLLRLLHGMHFLLQHSTSFVCVRTPCK